VLTYFHNDGCDKSVLTHVNNDSYDKLGSFFQVVLTLYSSSGYDKLSSFFQIALFSSILFPFAMLRLARNSLNRRKQYIIRILMCQGESALFLLRQKFLRIQPR
jgi:hypothetical protein